MKVLHVGEYVQGGIATYIQMLLQINREYNIENYLILSSNKSAKRWNLDDKHILFYPYKRSVIGGIKAIFIISRYISNIAPDIVYCHSSWAGFFCRLPLLFSSKKIKVIYNAHGWSFLRDTSAWKKKAYAMVERILSKVTDKIINVSEYEYKASLKYGIDYHKQQVIYSGISDKNTCRIIKSKGKYIKILYVGRFDTPKGIDILLNAFKKCMRKDIKLTLIGDVVVGQSYKFEKNNSNNISFLGWVPHENIGYYYEKCDAVIMPSRWEAFGLVAVEAMMYGKPVIASNRGALPEIIKDGKNGWIFDIEETNELVKILDNLELEEIYNRGLMARKIYEKNFTSENMLKKTLTIYEKLSGDCI